MKHLVIALFNENSDWINEVPDDWDVFVYHKGHQSLNLPRAKIIKLPNHGRESHSYFTHIVEHYDNLADLTVFCQGRYLDHAPTLHLDKNTITEMHRSNHPLSRPDKGYVTLGPGFWLHDSVNVDMTRKYSLKLWLRTYGHVNYPRYAVVSWGHQYAITKQLIHKFSKEWYETILKDHENSQYKDAPYVMEQYLPELYLELKIQPNQVVTKLF